MEKIQALYPFLHLAFYQFLDFPAQAQALGRDLPAIKRHLLTLARKWGLRGTILIAPEGWNVSIVGAPDKIVGWRAELSELGLGASQSPQTPLRCHESFATHWPFQKMVVKVKKQIIPATFDLTTDTRSQQRLQPQELKQWLEQKRDFLLLDTRNRHETELGSFQAATLLPLNHFRDFKAQLEHLLLLGEEKSKTLPPACDPALRSSSGSIDTPSDHHPTPESIASSGATPPPPQVLVLVLFCTGGIRCEKAAVIAQDLGFTQVYQLEGGILNYFKHCGAAHYQGSCFVFDERVALGADLKSTEHCS